MPFFKSKQAVARQQKLAQAGNTIVEYGLIGVSIVVVAIVGLQVTGGNLNDLFSQMKTDINHQVQATSTADAKHTSAKLAFQAATSALINTNPGALPNSSGSANGSSAAPVTQTVGANGTTDTYAQNINDQAQQSLASGKITQEEYNQIVNLANKGHDIAMIQGLLENAFTNSKGDSNAYANSKLTFNGQSYTPAQMNALLQSNTSDFSNLKSQVAVLNGVLYDQALLSTVDSSGSKIINNGYATQQQNQSADSFIQYQSGSPTGGSNSTNQESATICTSGQHMDSNNHCVQ